MKMPIMTGITPLIVWLLKSSLFTQRFRSQPDPSAHNFSGNSDEKNHFCWQAVPCCYPVVQVSKAVSTAMPQRLIPV
jgi:hypothetical protein